LANSCADGYRSLKGRNRTVFRKYWGAFKSSNRLAFEILFGIPNSRETYLEIRRGSWRFVEIWDLKNDLAFTQPDV